MILNNPVNIYFCFQQPNGRFEVNRKICLSISGHHPESWLPSWSIRTALLAIIGFMPSPGMGAIASLDYTQEERQRLAKKSLEFVCPECGKILNLLQEPSQLTTNENEAVQAEAREIAAQVTMKGESNNENPTEEHANTEEPIAVIQPPPPPQQVQTASTNNNNDLTYNYIIAAIIVALAILLFRRFASGTSAA